MQDYLLFSEIHTAFPTRNTEDVFPPPLVLPLCRKACKIIKPEEEGEDEAGIGCWVMRESSPVLLQFYLLYCCYSFKVMLETKIIIRKE